MAFKSGRIRKIMILLIAISSSIENDAKTDLYNSPEWLSAGQIAPALFYFKTLKKYSDLFVRSFKI